VLLLVVESATDTAAVALADESGALGSLVVARGRRHTETIAPAIEALCHRTGVALSDLDILGVDVGPGLFTGLRVGVGTVKALAFALDIPVVTATSLEVLAHALAGSGALEGRLLVPVVDARRGEVFSASFRSGPVGATAVGATAVGATAVGADPATPEALSTLEVVSTPEALAEDLAGRGEPLLLAGDGALRYGSLLGAVPGVTLAGAAFATPPVGALAELCVARGRAGLVHNGAEVMPRYLRDADARINWRQRTAPRVAATGAGA
jgi:tRNA threonylcarbamoyladenosine biosynthesis protein TsaB